MWLYGRCTEYVTVSVILAALSHLADGKCNAAQVKKCKDAGRSGTLARLDSGGTCSEQRYVHYTHTCTVRDYRPQVDFCCCAVREQLFCCRYHHTWDRFRCSSADDIIDTLSLPLETLLLATLVPILVLLCCASCIVCCCCRKYDDETGKVVWRPVCLNKPQRSSADRSCSARTGAGSWRGSSLFRNACPSSYPDPSRCSGCSTQGGVKPDRAQLTYSPPEKPAVERAPPLNIGGEMTSLIPSAPPAATHSHQSLVPTNQNHYPAELPPHLHPYNTVPSDHHDDELYSSAVHDTTPLTDHSSSPTSQQSAGGAGDVTVALHAGAEVGGDLATHLYSRSCSHQSAHHEHSGCTPHLLGTCVSPHLHGTCVPPPSYEECLTHPALPHNT